MSQEANGLGIEKIEQMEKLCRDLEIQLRKGQRMSIHTALGIGGLVDIAYPKSRESTAIFVAQLEEMGIPWVALGAGYGILAHETLSYRVAVSLKLLEELLSFQEDQVVVPGGYRIARVAIAAKERKLAGLEDFLTIPGTVAGLLKAKERSKAGSLWQMVERLYIAQGGKVIELTGHDLESYQQGLILSVVLKLRADDGKVVKQPKKQVQYKQDVKGTGPIFRNVKGRSPGSMILKLGLAELRIGDASLAPWDGNFIINHGAATFDDVMELIKEVRAEVKTVCCIKLKSMLDIWQ